MFRFSKIKLFIQLLGEGLSPKESVKIAEDNALLVLTNHKTGGIKKIWGHNLISTAGDVWYAQKACGETPTNAFANLYLATACSEAGGNPTKTSNLSHFTLHSPNGEKAKSSGYPKTNDDDVDNTGKATDIVSWKFEYTTGDGPFVNVTHSLIAKASATGSDPILNGYKWAAAWSKDASTSAKIFFNHDMTGA